MEKRATIKAEPDKKFNFPTEFIFEIELQKF